MLIFLEVDTFFFFFFDDNPELIAQMLKQNELRAIQDSPEYWFQNALNAFRDFESDPISSGNLDELISLTSRPNFKFKGILDELATGVLHDFWLLTGKLIAYIDSKAAMKNELNKYADKRTLAQLFVRQNVMMKNIFLYKREGSQADIPQIIHNVISYLKNPEDEVSCFAPDYRERISKMLNQNEGFTTVLPYLRKHGASCINPLNDGYVCSRILYTNSVYSQWIPQKEQRKAKYWLYAPGEGAKYWDEFFDHGIMAIGWDGLGDYAQYKNKKAVK